MVQEAIGMNRGRVMGKERKLGMSIVFTSRGITRQERLPYAMLLPVTLKMSRSVILRKQPPAIR